VFAGGECVFGPRLIIDSVADGKRAAIGIDEHLRGCKYPEPQVEVEVLSRHRIFHDYMTLARQPIAMLPVEQRIGASEVEIGYDEQSAMAEARRCLHCWINTIFEGTIQHGTECVLCGGCVDVCPEECLRLVPLEQIEFEPATLESIRGNPQLFAVELNDIAAEELGVVTGSALLKDESRCIRCGACALRCPADTITMEAYSLIATAENGLVPVTAFDMPEESVHALLAAKERK
jgi:ferredoxin